MKRTIVVLLACATASCGDGDENAVANNAASNNAASNNATSNNATTSNNSTTTTGASNNTTPAADFITADIDGMAVLANSAEGGVEPMGATVQLRKTTADTAGGGRVLIYRISLPNTDIADYSCAADDVSVTYSQLDGQLINNWVAQDTCEISVTQGGDAAGDVIVGTFSASATDGATTIALTNGEFSLTR